MKIKPLTFGQASFFHKGQGRDANFIRRVIDFSEKSDSIFWNIKDELFCSFSEDGIWFLEAVKQNEILDLEFSVVRIGIESMQLKRMCSKYPDNPEGIEKAKSDFENGNRNSMFLTKSNKF